jgi:serine/threonine protein kinase
MVQELVEGGTDLYEYIKQQKERLDETGVKRIFWQLADGLEHLQSLGIVHRDIKLENIMV